MTQCDLRNPCKWCMRKTTALRKGSDGTTADGISKGSYLMGSLNFLLTTNDDIADDSILFIFFFGRVGVFFCFDILQRWRFFFWGGEGWCVLIFPKWLLLMKTMVKNTILRGSVLSHKQWRKLVFIRKLWGVKRNWSSKFNSRLD